MDSIIDLMASMVYESINSGISVYPIKYMPYNFYRLYVPEELLSSVFQSMKQSTLPWQ